MFIQTTLSHRGKYQYYVGLATCHRYGDTSPFKVPRQVTALWFRASESYYRNGFLSKAHKAR